MIFLFTLQSTTWVKRESEKQASDVLDIPTFPNDGEPLNLKPCFLEDADGNNARYETHCIDDYVNRRNTVSEIKIEVEPAESVTESITELDIESVESVTESDTDSQFADSDTESQLTEETENEIFDEIDSRADANDIDSDIEIASLEEETNQEL